MPMVPYRPGRILVQKDAWQDPLTGQVLDRLPGVPVTTIRDPDEAVSALPHSGDPRTAGKRTLVLARYPGSFLKECPGKGAEVCCDYYVLNFASNCHLECTYCVLQAFLNNPTIQVYTNAGDLLAEIRALVESSKRRTFRIGTGELADSLALDGITRYSSILVPFFASLPRGVLELKTKSDQIGNLESLDHRGHTVVSWSLNTERICLEEELKTPGLQERLAAAQRCQQWGYPIGFHFDPIIWYEGWEEEYQAAVARTFNCVDPKGIAWVSLGALRFTPGLRELVRERFPRSLVPRGEFVPAHHGKLRYFRPIREEMYAKMSRWIREAAPGVLVYLCMESCMVWERSLDIAHRDAEELSDRMDHVIDPHP